MAAQEAKAGPFALLLCVGRFWPADDAAAEVKDAFEQYLKGAKTMPIPTYVCDATRHGSEYPLGKNLAGNLTVSFRLAEHL